MSRYFFHVCDDVVVYDWQGRELADDDAARSVVAAERFADANARVAGEHRRSLEVRVTDDSGKLLFRQRQASSG